MSTNESVKPLPQQGLKISQAEQRARAAAFRDTLAGLLVAGPATAIQLAAIKSVRPQMIRDYMRTMAAAGRVKSKRAPAESGQGVSAYVAWYSLPADETPLPARVLEVAKPPLPGEAPRRTISNQYPPNKVRDPFALPAEFFGLPA